MIDRDFETLMNSKHKSETWMPTQKLTPIQEEAIDILTNPVKDFRQILEEMANSPEGRQLIAVNHIPDNKRVTFETIRYGQLVHAAQLGGHFSAASKVHFYNHRGVLVGNTYEFLPYEFLKLHDKGTIWERVAYGKSYERIRTLWYRLLCKMVDILIRKTQYLSK